MTEKTCFCDELRNFSLLSAKLYKTVCVPESLTSPERVFSNLTQNSACAHTCGGMCGRGHLPCGENCKCVEVCDNSKHSSCFNYCVSKNCPNPIIFGTFGCLITDSVCGKGCTCGNVFGWAVGTCDTLVEPCPACGGSCGDNSQCGEGCICDSYSNNPFNPLPSKCVSATCAKSGFCWSNQECGDTCECGYWPDSNCHPH